MLSRVKRMIKKRLGALGIHIEPEVEYSKDRADDEYTRGRWDYLSGLPELERYSVIVGYCQYFFPEGEYLDIGCGEGILQQRLSILPYKKYRGVDFSEVAINKARKHSDQLTSFIASDAETYIDENKYDVIIFNECLYCFNDPKMILQHYKQNLKSEGIFVISMYKDEVADHYWDIIDPYTNTIAQAQVVKSKEISWTLKVVTF